MDKVLSTIPLQNLMIVKCVQTFCTQNSRHASSLFPLVLIAACASRLDIGILLDGSSSIVRNARGNFRRLIDFMNVFISSFPFKNRRTRIGVVLFSNKPHLIFGLNRYSSKKTIYRRINRIRFPRGKTYLGRALTFSSRRLFAGRGSRGRKRFLLVLTDGISVDSVRSPAAALRKKGVEIAVVGVGARLRIAQLHEVATTRRHVFVTGFRKLAGHSVLAKLRSIACHPVKPSKCFSFP